MDLRRVGMFPLGTVVYPHAEVPLHVFEPRYRALVRDCLSDDGTFGTVLIVRGSEVGGGDHRAGTGTLTRIRGASETPDGRWAVVARATHRIRVVEWLPEEPYPVALVEELPAGSEVADAATLAAAAAAVWRTRWLLSELGEHPAPPMGAAAGGNADWEPDERLWRLCAAAPLTSLTISMCWRSTEPTNGRGC